jgi:hypothetical protein
VGAHECTRLVYSLRGLGGMSYPFKGFESSEWAYLGKTRGHAGQLQLLRFVLRCVGRWVIHV